LWFFLSLFVVVSLHDARADPLAATIYRKRKCRKQAKKQKKKKKECFEKD